MRLPLPILAALASLALGVSATAAQPANRQAKLVIGWAEPLDTLNPATTGTRDAGPIYTNIFNTLVWLTKDLQPTPDLATKWSVSGDGKTYDFTLRQGVTFQDGMPFNAEAVVANFDYITNAATESKIALSILGPCTSAKAVSTYDVQISCATPFAPLIRQLGSPYLSMQSPQAIHTYGNQLGLHPVGTGPFEMVRYTPNQSLVLKRNDAFQWGPPATGHQGPPDIAQVIFDIVPSAQARIAQFQSGQSQMMQETPGIFWNVLRRTNRYDALAVPITGMGIFAPLDTSKWPTDDLAVRKAILYAVDRQGVIALADSGVFPLNTTPLEPGMLGYDAALANAYPYDPAKAAAILQADGWTKQGKYWEKDGRPLTLTITAISTVSEYPLLAQAIQGYLQKAGMDAQVQQLATPAWLASNIKGDMSLTPLQYIGLDPDALHLWFLPHQYFNWSHVNDPQLASLLLDGEQTLDPAKRALIYQQVQSIIMNDALEMPIHQNIDLVMTSKALTGVTYSGGGYEYLGVASLAQ
jgi:peptide/nickel transport system substrate-binding protein